MLRNMSRKVSLTILFLVAAVLGLAVAYVRVWPAQRQAPESKPVRVPTDRTTGSVFEKFGLAGVIRTARNPSQRGPGVSRVSEPEPGAIRDEYILSFYSEQDREKFLNVAASLGVDVLDAMKLGFSIRIRADSDLLAALLDQAPSALEFSSNYLVRNPQLPFLDPWEPENGYVIFGGRVLEWLGVRDNAGWGSGIKVAVLDSGVNPHPALGGVSISRLDLLGGDGAENPHGTAVASLIAGNSESVKGMAPGVEILSIRVVSGDGEGNLFTAAKGIMEAADAGASVINCSFGTRVDSFLLRAAVEYAAGLGAVVVVSTGNDSVLGVSYPAAYPEAVAVSAVDARGEHLYFANRGEAVDISAPGLGIEAAWTGDSTGLFSGTSAAAPLVSGAIAAVMSENRNLTALQAAQIVEEYSNDAAAPGRDDELGIGIMNMRRVEQRDEKGIYDVTLGSPYLVSAGDGQDVSVSVYAQNTGTEPLETVVLVVDINGAKHSQTFSNVQVGQTVSHDILLAGEELELEGTISIDAAAAIEGAQDVYPADNARIVGIVYDPPEPGSGTEH